MSNPNLQSALAVGAQRIAEKALEKQQAEGSGNALKIFRSKDGNRKFVTVPNRNVAISADSKGSPEVLSLPAPSGVSDATTSGTKSDGSAQTAHSQSSRQGTYKEYSSRSYSRDIVLPKGALYAKMKLHGRLYYAINPILLHALANRKHSVAYPHIEFFYGTWESSPVGRDAMWDRVEEGLKKK
jgi:hypothetical protein